MPSGSGLARRPNLAGWPRFARDSPLLGDLDGTRPQLPQHAVEF